jgi:hypothetical protein
MIEVLLLTHAAATLVMVGVIWFVQIVHFVQVRLHSRLADGFDAAIHRRLVQSNWLRTAAWTGRGILVLIINSGA